jgi:hypothetical protein
MRHHAPNAPGTTAGSSPVAGIKSRPSDAKWDSVAASGAVPWPQITCCVPVWALCTMIGASPPGPFKCGSATWSTKPAAAAASKALPPRSSTAMPTAVASQCVLAATPKVPAISGRVVNHVGSIGSDLRVARRRAYGQGPPNHTGWPKL